MITLQPYPDFNELLPSQSLYLGPLLSHGTQAQMEKWVSPFLDGEHVGCFCLSEPGITSGFTINHYFLNITA